MKANTKETVNDLVEQLATIIRSDSGSFPRVETVLWQCFRLGLIPAYVARKYIILQQYPQLMKELGSGRKAINHLAGVLDLSTSQVKNIIYQNRRTFTADSNILKQ